MNSLRSFALVLSITFAVLMLAVMAVLFATPTAQASQASNEVERAPAQGVRPIIALSLTVGTDPNNCATGLNVSTANNREIYFCYRVRNTGELSVSTHSLTSSPIGPSFSNVELLIQPGEEITRIEKYLVSEPNTTITSRDIAATWTAVNTALPEVPLSTSASRTVGVFILRPSVAITYTVGTVENECGASNVAVIQSGSSVFHCLRIVNTGQLSLTQHTIQMPLLGISTTIPFDLQRGQILTITEANRATLGIANAFVQSNITGTQTSTAAVSSLTASNDRSVTLTANVAISLGVALLKVDQFVATDPTTCPTADTTVLPANSTFYLCVSVTNVGNLPFVQHNLLLLDRNLSIDFTYPLSGNAKLDITNNFIVNTLKQPGILGPYTLTQGSLFSIVYNGTTADGYRYSTQSGSSMNVATPTATRTLTPTSTPLPTSTFPDTPTYTPPPTGTGSPTPIPTPTFTPPTPPTPVIIPTPTNTSFPIIEAGSVFNSVLATPSPVGFVGAAPPLGLDPVFVQQTEQAFQLTQQALLLPPTLDPFVAAQQTEQANFATATALALFATPTIDPFLITPTLDPAFATPIVDPNLQPAVPEVAALAAPITVTATFTPLPPTEAPPTIRPIEPPTPPIGTDTLSVFSTVAARMITVAGWIWFLFGSLVFFIVAGIMAGMSWQQREANRYELFEYYDPDIDAITPRTLPPNRASQSNDDWPDDLP